MRQERSGASRSLESDRERYKYVLLQDTEARADVSLKGEDSYNNPSYGKTTLRNVKAYTIVQGILDGTYIVLTNGTGRPSTATVAEYLTSGRPWDASGRMWNAQIDRERAIVA